MATAPGPALLDAVTGDPLTSSTTAGLLLPLLVGLLTTSRWPAPARGLLLLAAAFALAAGAELLERAGADARVVLGPVDWRGILAATFTTWVAAQSAHQGVWRRTGLLGWLQRVGEQRPRAERDQVRATVERAQGDVPDREPAADTVARVRDTVRPRPSALPRDPAREARARERYRITRPPGVDPTPSGRHALIDDDEPPPSTLQER